MNSQLPTIIFDYFGVITSETSFEKYIKHSKTLKLNAPLKKNINVFYKHWDISKVSKDYSFFNGVAKNLGLNSDLIEKDMVNYFSTNDTMLKLIKSLRSKYNLVLLTNHVDEWLEKVIKKDNLSSVFDLIVSSCEEGVAKPNEKIFRLVLSKLDSNADSVLFIDDSQQNIDAAKKIGMRTFRHKNINTTLNFFKTYRFPT